MVTYTRPSLSLRAATTSPGTPSTVGRCPTRPLTAAWVHTPSGLSSLTHASNCWLDMVAHLPFGDEQGHAGGDPDGDDTGVVQLMMNVGVRDLGRLLDL